MSLQGMPEVIFRGRRRAVWYKAHTWRRGQLWPYKSEKIIKGVAWGDRFGAGGEPRDLLYEILCGARKVWDSSLEGVELVDEGLSVCVGHHRHITDSVRYLTHVDPHQFHRASHRPNREQITQANVLGVVKILRQLDYLFKSL